MVRVRLESAAAKGALDMRPGEAAAILRGCESGALTGEIVGYGSDNMGRRSPET